MGKFVTPKAFLIAETIVHEPVMMESLRHLGVDDWVTDAPDPSSLLTEFAGKSCYMSFDKALNQNLTTVGGRNNHDYIQQGIVAQNHGSVLEHSTVTFFMTNVSRVVTHELVRHRAGTAFSQTSGRYVRSSEVDLYVPNDILDCPEAVMIFRKAIREMEDNVRALSDATNINTMGFAFKKKLTSAFRRITGNGVSNHLVMTANHRAWRHVIEMRTSPHAEEEIRVIMADVSRQLRARFPNIYGDATVTIENEIEVTTFKRP